MESLRPTYKLCFYVPESHVEQVKNAVFTAGAGQLGEYDQACWQTLGQGQFRPSPEANPAIGATGELTYVKEYKVEMLCHQEKVKEVITALISSHPYEEPAYDLTRLEWVSSKHE